MQQLATLQGKTLDTAEKARADALARAQTLATEGLNKASDIMKAKAEARQQKKPMNKRQKPMNKRRALRQLQTAVADMRSHAAGVSQFWQIVKQIRMQLTLMRNRLFN